MEPQTSPQPPTQTPPAPEPPAPAPSEPVMPSASGSMPTAGSSPVPGTKKSNSKMLLWVAVVIAVIVVAWLLLK
ncbi:MAG: hypothetical protein AAB541_02435 [Patescibacteria group bacterium]